MEKIEVKEVYVHFNNRAITERRNKTPGCDNGGRINLISYFYQSIVCVPGHSCNVTHETNMSLMQEYLLHKLCSFKEECSSLDSLFSIESLNSTETGNSIVNTLKIVYQCLASYTQYIQICNDEKTTTNRTTHLLFYHNSNPFTECVCFVKGGEFRVTLNDIRLTSVDQDICSTAKLYINSNVYHCNSTKADFGSVFRLNMKEEASRVFVSLSKDSASGNPSMVWLTIQSEKIVNIDCSLKNEDIDVHTAETNSPSNKPRIMKQSTGSTEKGHPTPQQATENQEIFRESETQGSTKKGHLTSQQAAENQEMFREPEKQGSTKKRHLTSQQATENQEIFREPETQGSESNGNVTTAQATELTRAFQVHETQGKEETVSVLILGVTASTSFAVALVCGTCVYLIAVKRKRLLYCLSKGALRMNISKEVKELNTFEVQDNVDPVDIGTSNNEQVCDIRMTNALISDPSPCDMLIAESGASYDYQEIQDVISIYATSEITYEKIDPDLRHYDSGYSKVQSKPKVHPKPNFRRLPPVPITNDERNMNLATEQRNTNDVDYLHPIEKTSGTFKMQLDTEECQYSSHMGDDTLIIDHQSLINSDELINTNISAEEESDNDINTVRNIDPN